MRDRVRSYFGADTIATRGPRIVDMVTRAKTIAFEKTDSVLKSVLDSTAETLQTHGHGASVELVRDQSGSDPNSYPYITLHFSPERCNWRCKFTILPKWQKQSNN